MSSITITNPPIPGTTINATNKRVPRRLNATAFEDSNMTDSANQTTIYDTVRGNGLNNTYTSEIVKLGQQLSSGKNTFIEINNANGTINLNGTDLEAAGAGAASGNFLIIQVNGNPYKLDLLNL